MNPCVRQYTSNRRRRKNPWPEDSYFGKRWRKGYEAGVFDERKEWGMTGLCERLRELAERCEKATADQQRELLADAFYEIHGESPVATDIDSGYVAKRFAAMLRAEAYESAAMTLVPEGWELFKLEQHRSWPGDPRGDCWLYEAVMLELHGPGFSKSSALTPALALCAAALKAQPQPEDSK